MGLIAEKGENVIHKAKVVVDNHLRAERSYPLQAREPITEGASRQASGFTGFLMLR